eukprot:TRINITY_DN1706_c0_g2_i1.p1 TRINITY_DN1706_c0_g2~~TRINITY_DN1706_c0_g2_i1.p1  ORF type:complete len:352 (+),score=156.73 TRINITY_DN1706_c0_g2_i1:67-1122(+)
MMSTPTPSSSSPMSMQSVSPTSVNGVPLGFPGMLPGLGMGMGMGMPDAMTMLQYQQMQLLQQAQLLQQLQNSNANLAELHLRQQLGTLADASFTTASSAPSTSRSLEVASSGDENDSDADAHSDVPLLSATPVKNRAGKGQQFPYVLRPGAWEDRRNLIVTNLPAAMTENGLRKLFERFGTITRVHVVRDRDTDASRKFGFVEFEDVVSSKSALQLSRKLTPPATDAHPNPQPVVIAYGRRSNERRSGNTVYIGGFGSSLREASLITLCKQYGSIVSARVLDPKKHTDGVAFVKFSKADDALKACRTLDGSDVMCHPGKKKTLRVRLSDEVGKTEQRQQISSMLKDIKTLL